MLMKNLALKIVSKIFERAAMKMHKCTPRRRKDGGWTLGSVAWKRKRKNATATQRRYFYQISTLAAVARETAAAAAASNGISLAKCNDPWLDRRLARI